MPPALLDALLAYAHFLSIFATFAMLAVELVLCKGALTLPQVRRLGRIDIAYFACAMAVLGSGIARLLWGAKGAAFHMHNPAFHMKMGLFVLVGVLSIAPTMRFIAWRKRLGADAQAVIGADEVKRAARLLHIELALLAAIPLCAVLMSRGIGM